MENQYYLKEATVKKYFYIIVCLSLIVLTAISCSNPNIITSGKVNLPNSRPTPLNGDLVKDISGILPNYSVNDLINLSEKIVIGSVKEILPAQKGIRSDSGENLIYTDILITPEKYLYGEISSNPIVVRVWGGKIGGNVETYDDEPIFTLNEHIIVFLSEFSSVSPLNGKKDVSYYRVVGNLLGKYIIQDNEAFNDKTNGRINLTTIGNQIESIKKRAKAN
jgi:hypothetical protein